jgi:hypothetical protein
VGRAPVLRLALLLLIVVALLAVPAAIDATTLEGFGHTDELVDPNPHLYDRFGWSVAIDGDTLVVGVPFDDGLGINRGAVHVFVRSGGTFVHTQELADPNPGELDEFGSSVAIDGDTLVVGVPEDGGVGVNRGAAHVFVRSGGTFTHTQELLAPNPDNGDEFGSSVAVDGDTLVVGAPGDDGAGSSRGAAHVFVRSGGTFTHSQELVDPNAADGDVLGSSVAVDGDTLVVGAPWDDGAGPPASYRGAAHVFVRSGGTFTHSQELVDPNAADGDVFGSSVAIDGDTIVVGAHVDDGAGDERGAVHLYVVVAPSPILRSWPTRMPPTTTSSALRWRSKEIRS